MVHTKQNRQMYFCISACIVALLIIYKPAHADLSSLAKNDPYPVFSTLNLDDLYLLTKEQLKYKDKDWAQRKKNHVNFSISPFTQNADRGKTIKDQPCPPLFGDERACPELVDPLGDLTGNAGMLPLLYGKLPAYADNQYPGPYLSLAFSMLFPFDNPGTVTNGQFIDPRQLFGFFSFPLKYRKRGIRFELDVLCWKGLGFRIQAGVSTIRQTVENRINLTDRTHIPQTDPDVNTETVNEFLMDQVENIMQEIGIDIGDVNQSSSEEVRLNAFWRHAFELNMASDYEWAHVLCIPYLEVSGSFSPGKMRNPNQLFAVPFGNNGHPSAGFTAGINFDFVETIEIGGEVSFTHFFKKKFDSYPVPTSQFQSTIFPFKTDVSIQPGSNMLFGARLAAYHFVGNLSTYFEWFVIDHKKDEITLRTCDPNNAFLPKVLEDTTSFKVKFANFALNYDVSPNIGLGFLWQIPFSQRNAYRSSTLMLGVNITF